MLLFLRPNNLLRLELGWSLRKGNHFLHGFCLTVDFLQHFMFCIDIIVFYIFLNSHWKGTTCTDNQSLFWPCYIVRLRYISLHCTLYSCVKLVSNMSNVIKTSKSITTEDKVKTRKLFYHLYLLLAGVGSCNIWLAAFLTFW